MRDGAFIGVDPGLSGAIACWRPVDRWLVVIDMPTLAISKNAKVKRSVDAIQLAHQLRDMVETAEDDVGRIHLALIEQSGARPNEGLGSAHANGRNWGVAYGVLCAQMVPADIVTPQSWKRDMGCPRDKDGARARASALLPQFAEYWKLAKHDGRAEAALIALYAEIKWRQMNQREAA